MVTIQASPDQTLKPKRNRTENKPTLVNEDASVQLQLKQLQPSPLQRPHLSHRYATITACAASELQRPHPVCRLAATRRATSKQHLRHPRLPGCRRTSRLHRETPQPTHAATNLRHRHPRHLAGVQTPHQPNRAHRRGRPRLVDAGGPQPQKQHAPSHLNASTSTSTADIGPNRAKQSEQRG
jgi:hypothetical protein